MTQQASAWPRLGIFSDVVPADDWATLIALCKQTGLSALQLAGRHLQAIIDDPDQLSVLQRLLKESGIMLVGLAGYRNIVATDPEKQQANIVFLQSCLKLAAQLEHPVVATETGTRHPDNDWIATPENQSREAWQSLYIALDELLAVAQQYKTILALEGYVNNIITTVEQMDEVIKRYSSPHLQVMLDPYNYLTRQLLPVQEQVAADFFRRFEHHFVIAHLKDVSLEGAERDTPEFGLGVFTQQHYLAFLRTRRPDLPLILEHLPWEHIPAVIERIYNTSGA